MLSRRLSLPLTSCRPSAEILKSRGEGRSDFHRLSQYTPPVGSSEAPRFIQYFGMVVISGLYPVIVARAFWEYIANVTSRCLFP
jgi:hypothetical protein